ncbi:MAG: tetratricopeptide repeat-containing glycosyltransferase family protein [Pseudomonadota bacterium]
MAVAQQQKRKTVTLGELFNAAVDLHQKGEIEKAAPLYRTYLAKAPEHARGWTNYGALLRKMGQHRQAIAAHRRALEIDPGMENARNNLSNALADAGEYAEAAELRQGMFEAAPEDHLKRRDYCVALRGLGQHERVIELVTEVEDKIDLEKDGELLLQRALSRLMLGDYRGGFLDFEGRYAGTEVSLPQEVPWPRWTGQEISGKRVLVLPEQGFGDAILMTRFLPALKAMGADVSMVVKAPLQRLFEGLEGLDRLVSHARKSDVFDYYTPNMSLPHLVGFRDGNTPPPLPKFSIPGPSRKRAKALAAPFAERLKIGVVWTGSLTYKANHRRSTGPESFLSLAQVPGVQLFSLYKGPARDEFVASGMAGLILDACGDDQDFADSAALIDEMDLMITTDTAVVHVAASLGKPVWNLLSHEGFWLYGQGDTTPWYPSMKLYRQRATGDWDELFQRVEADLRAHLKARS